MELIKQLLTSLLGSKKFVTMLAGVLLTIAIRVGMDPVVAKDVIPGILTLVATYVLGQGIADHGKEKAKIVAESALRDLNGEKTGKEE